MQTEKWLEMYRRKLVSIDDAVNQVPDHASIAVGMCAAEPPGLLSRLHTLHGKRTDIRVLAALLMRPYEWIAKPEYADTFKHEAWFYGEAARQATKAHGQVTVIPNNLHRAGKDRFETKPVNVLFHTVSPMDKHGYFSMSLSTCYERWVLESADLVIVEVNENTPRTFGDTMLHISQVDWIVENHVPVAEFTNIKPGPEEEAIAGYVADMIEDGSTIQLGIGGIPNAVATFLKDKRDLGVHTEMVVDAMLELYEAGVITNARKTLDRYKTVGCFAAGSRRLYDWLDNNPAIEIRDGNYTNDPYNIAKQPKMISINTAISVDLTGQVCSESLGPVQYSGTGGQRDTHVGAWMSEGGKGIICLRSTAKGGTISTIAPMLAPGSVVTMTRNDLDYVVTEYGVARMRGLSAHDRCANLINIAHPNFRDQLKEEAQKYGWLPRR
ncbi:MAG TPA: acetyl-CoA hydrolase/transferase C-terminal domain-containing protein [Symbiobacteriaceae bacterium]|nr:acetyl-CoA hydrolase/transferase C-terminal domain-containing protein [Symbiobacteriaceae bacterium]